MKNILKLFVLLVTLFIYSGCGKTFLETANPTTILTEAQVWNDEAAITNLIANLYNRVPAGPGATRGGGATIANDWANWSCFDEAIPTGTADLNKDNNNLSSYATNRWTLWNYDLNRDINLALDGIDNYSTKIIAAKKTILKAQLRFLRAYNYFELVKRMGGVPIITQQLIYDNNGNPAYLQRPRNTEAEVYDFIASELDAIKNDLSNAGSKDWANKYSAMALKCRAMLYAGSIAKYNNLMPVPITTPGGEVGIPAARSTGYYQSALDAAKEIITSGQYQLYTKNPNLGENFYEALTKKTGNTEMIMVMDFNISKNKKHNFSYQNICRTMREDNLSSSSLCPTLNLVEAFEYLDGTAGTLKGVGTGSNTAAGQTNWIFYNNLSDIFANKDARLYGTVVYPGTSFKGVDVNIQAGVYVWNATTSQYDRFESTSLGSKYTDGKLYTGLGGPTRTVDETTNTGFYMKKFIDPATLSSARGVGSDIAWPRFRYAEVLLNAAEAAFELGDAANLNDAVTWVNMVRERAGFPANSLTTVTLTFAKLVNERRVELAFEDHRTFDLARWRQAHIVWNGSSGNPTAMMSALFPYRIVRPGHANDGKYVFDKLSTAPKFLAARFYQLKNYYSSIDQAVLNNNPLIVKNPFH